jgi:hypothetical protein
MREEHSTVRTFVVWVHLRLTPWQLWGQDCEACACAFLRFLVDKMPSACRLKSCSMRLSFKPMLMSTHVGKRGRARPVPPR